MKEFMLYIRNSGDAKKSLSPDQHLEFVKKCEVYISKLKAENKLVAAQPLVREGIVIAKKHDQWNEQKLSTEKEVQVGYYHIMANDMDDAIRIAKANPEFEYVPSATVEVHPIKTKEAETGFVYPKG